MTHVGSSHSLFLTVKINVENGHPVTTTILEYF